MRIQGLLQSYIYLLFDYFNNIAYLEKENSFEFQSCLLEYKF